MLIKKKISSGFNLICNLFKKINTETFKSGVARRSWLIWCSLNINKKNISDIYSVQSYNDVYRDEKPRNRLTFLNMTKGSSILERTLRVMLGGRPSVKAYLSVMTRLLSPLHSPTFSSFSDFNFNKSSLKSTLRPSLNLEVNIKVGSSLLVSKLPNWSC